MFRAGRAAQEIVVDPGDASTLDIRSATRLFGHAAQAVVGREVWDVLMTGPGQYELVHEALADVGDAMGHGPEAGVRHGC